MLLNFRGISFSGKRCLDKRTRQLLLYGEELRPTIIDGRLYDALMNSLITN